MDENCAYTKVSFLDVNVEAKMFVRQMRYGTGSMWSTLDTVAGKAQGHQLYRHNRFWSLDGEFLDDMDPRWMFWQREFEYKYALSTDQFGKDQHRADAISQDVDATKKTTRTQRRNAYSEYRYSNRVGKFIPDSPAALTRNRWEWLAIGHVDNLGTPHSFTTFVGNVHSAAVVAHVQKGPIGIPNPEDSLDFVLGPKGAKINTTKHVCLRSAQYLRDRKRFEMTSDRNGSYDNMHGGRNVATARRREAQKRGDCHDHYNKWFETCGLVFSSIKVRFDRLKEEEDSDEDNIFFSSISA